jgi:CheY-like chemotaxis protein
MSRRALIVDDDAAACEVMRGVLASTGIDVLVVPRSSEAIQYLNNQKFAVLLLGLRMPAPDGSELARIARDSDINHMTPVILVTDQTIEGASHAGTTFFLHKPVDKAQLHKLLRAAQGAVEHEKRRFRRVALRSKVLLAFEQREWEGETVDVSLNGMLVRGPSRIAAGTTVNVSLFLSGEPKPVVGVGRITRVQDENLMGIYLNRLTIEESGRLQSFLLPMILQDEPEAKVIR